MVFIGKLAFALLMGIALVITASVMCPFTFAGWVSDAFKTGRA